MATYSTTNAPLPWMEPYLQDYMSRAQTVANTGYTPSPTTAVSANPYLQQGWQAVANRAMSGSPVMGAANQTLMNTLSGGYLSSGNPYLQSQIDAAQGDLAKNFNLVNKPGWDSRMAKAGGYNSGVAEVAANDYGNLSNSMGRIGSDMRYNAYNSERQLMNSALGMAPTYANQDYVDANALLNVGQQAQTFNQAQADQNYKWWQEAQQFPQNKLDAYGRALGVMSGGTSTQTAPDPSTASQVIGGGLTGIALWKALFGG